MAKLIFILTMATLAAAWGNLKKPNETPLFSEEGFPKAGDIPLLNRKVFKGTRVSSSEYPYMASIRRNLSHFLTGAILTRNVVITIAHPLFHVPSYELGVVVGESYSDRGTSVRPVLLLLFHQHFDPWTLKHDLALLRIFEEFNFKINLKPIPLAMQSDREAESLDGTTAFVAGWGRCDLMPNHLCLPRSSAYYPGEIQDPMLRSITFTLKTLTPSCDEYSKQGVTIYDGMLCQGVARAYAATAACLAVPGAPLAARGGLLGLQSWGFGCNYAADLPLIYTDLRRYQKYSDSFQ